MKTRSGISLGRIIDVYPKLKRLSSLSDAQNFSHSTMYESPQKLFIENDIVNEKEQDAKYESVLTRFIGESICSLHRTQCLDLLTNSDGDGAGAGVAAVY